MKILRLRFTNLNSLRDEWSVDFTLPPLSETGLFAITGPTGAGKTTILDAITLALYGRAARYGTEPSPGQMMSRHTGFCSAEVEFSCAKGVFRSVWQLKRARNQPAGKLQNPERRVISLPDEQVLTQKIDESNRKIEELTNLNYDRFLRSVMLAQGDFAAFLKAKPNERTELLEQITGTGIYSDISKAAYRYAGAAESLIEALRLRHAAVPLLTPEARDDRETQLTACNARGIQFKNDWATLVNRIDHAKNFLTCVAEATKIEAEADQLAQERKSICSELDALEIHEKARPFIARLTELDLLVKLLKEDEAKLATLWLDLPSLVESAAAKKIEAEAAHQRLEEAEREAENLKPLWEEITRRDGEILLKRNTLQQRTEARQQAEEAQQKLQNDLAAKQQLLKKHQAARADLAEWLRGNAVDAGIAAILPELRTSYAQWKDHRGQWDEIRKEVASLTLTIQNNEKKLAHTEAEATKLKADWEGKEAAASKIRGDVESLAENRTVAEWEQNRDAAQSRLTLLNELHILSGEIVGDTARHVDLQATIKGHTSKKESFVVEVGRKNDQLLAAIELTTAQKKNVDLIRLVQTMEQHRHELSEGQACPLCGSLEHPYASPENAPSVELSKATADLKKADVQQEKLRQELADIEKQRATNASEEKRAVNDLQKTADLIAHREKQWAAKINSVGITLTAMQTAELEALLANEVQKHTQLKRLVENLRDLDLKLRAAEQAAEKAKSLLTAKNAEHDKLGSLLQQMKESVDKATTRANSSEKVVNETRAAFLQNTGTFAMEVPDLRGAESALEHLKLRSDDFAGKQEKRTTTEHEIGRFEAGIAEVEKQFKSDAEKIEILQGEEKKDLETVQTLLNAREGKFGSKIVSADQDRMAALIKACRQKSSEASDFLTKAAQQESTCRKDIASLDMGGKDRSAKITEDTTTLTREANEAGFTTIEQLQQAVLPEARSQEISTFRKRLDDGELKLFVRRSANNAARATVPDTAKDDAPLIETLEDQQNTLESGREALDQKRGALQEELIQNEKRRKAQVEISDQIEAADREFQRWNRLSALIGSGNGAVFARFAQGLTLERLVAVANRHLAQLSPRYSMRRSNTTIDDLELEIIDRYQADVTRPMRSLSGGESFLVSLALAVGLSELASGRTAIESLFIDEGFGSLDPATLEIAMAALEGLQTNGKTIGVISHVDTMKERISTQIQVQKADGGRSTLEVKY